jgi:large subunit ribosomal protein L22
MGRAYRIRKRTCHITVVVEGEPKTEVVKAAAPKTKAAPAPKEESKRAKSKAAERPSVEEKEKVDKKAKKTTRKAKA